MLPCSAFYGPMSLLVHATGQSAAGRKALWLNARGEPDDADWKNEKRARLYASMSSSTILGRSFMIATSVS